MKSDNDETLLTRDEIISKEFQRRGLVQLQLKHEITREQLTALHQLDHELCPYDLVGVFFEKLEELELDVKAANRAVENKIKKDNETKLALTDLQSKLDAARGALKFYADSESWFNTKWADDKLHFRTLTKNDVSPVTSESRLVGGKLARETLAKIGEK